MTFDTKNIKKIKKQIDFDKTKSELLIEFIHKMGDVGNDLKSHINKIMKNSNNIRELIKSKFKIYPLRGNYDNTLKIDEVISIDGSSNIGGQVSGKFVCLYSVARIHLKIHENNKIIPTENYWGDMQILDAVDEKDINKLLEVKMLQKETEAYNDTLNFYDNTIKTDRIVFIDGPIIDPPTYNEEDYVNFRCKTIIKLLEHNFLVIGCVKKIYGTNFINFIIKKSINLDLNEKMELFLNDNYFVSSIIANYRKKNKFYGPIISDLYNSTSNQNPIALNYKKMGIYIYSLFYQHSIKHKLIRVDIPIQIRKRNIKKDIYERVKTNLIEWSYPGINIPYPVYLAHEFSKIRNGCAQKIYEDVISRSLSNRPVGQLLINMLK